MAPTKLFLCSLFFFSCLLSMAASNYVEELSFFHIPANPKNDGRLTNSSLTMGYMPSNWVIEERPLPQIFKSPLEEVTYTSIFKTLWQKISGDMQMSLNLAKTISKDYLTRGACISRDAISSFIQSSAWAITWLWSWILLRTISWVLQVLINNTMLLVSLGLLGTCTVFMAKLLHLLFGSFSVWIVVPVWKTLRFLTSSSSKKGSKVKKEKMVKGFGSYDMMMSPPKNCILEVMHDNGQHSGYASCVLLASGELALLTSFHLYEDADSVYSRKTGNKIPIGEFKPIAGSQNGDLLLLAGPPNWTGLLGCKSVQLITMKSLAGGDARIFYLKNGEWYSGVAKIQGRNERHGFNFVDVLSNTEPGFSGTPYFIGNKIAGVHTGGCAEDNVNLMAAIPSLDGITASRYVFETTAPKGKIFDQDLWEELLEEFSMQEARTIMKRKAYIPEVTQEASPKTPLNGERGAVRGTTGNASTPMSKPEDGELMEKIMARLVEKINTSHIEEEAARLIARKSKTNKPRRSRRRSNGQHGGEIKQTPSGSSSKPNTTGKYLPPQKRFQGSKLAEKFPNSTTQSKNNRVDGVKKSSPSTQKWVEKSPVSAGQSLARRLN
ncbi:P1 protein [Faba bean polerovirus 1]|uniref:P1 protein n=1 Tax=Faba bean polerovirus 1 TaxID=2283388 RepID=A0A455KZJ7_9VIRU|nr:P1 protein [Faba bean polerovirus 1]AXP14382.1 P1 protein [Faba bean polerovirus 1]